MKSRGLAPGTPDSGRSKWLEGMRRCTPANSGDPGTTSGQGSPPRRGAVETVAMLGVVALYAIHVLRFVHVNADDQYMLYRYAANLARGAGLTFTAGDRVEGFTT